MRIFSDKKLIRFQGFLRLAAALVAVGLPMGLFIGGAQPVAVGLIAAPWDKLAHASVFAVLAAAMAYASDWRGWPMWLAGFGFALGIGALDEWHQMYLPGRSAGLDDLAADAIGGALGAAAVLGHDQVKAWLLQHLA
jgi:VanZ family protein